MSPKKTRISKKEAKLLDTAIELFKRYGIRRVSITELCDAAEVSKVTFYKYFPDKLELAKRTVALLSDRVLAGIDELAALDVPFPTKVTLLVEERLRRMREWSPDFIDDLYHFDPGLAALVVERLGRTRTRFIEFIEAAQARGDVRPELHPELVLAVLDALYKLGGDEALVRHVGGYERLTRDVNNLFYYGLISRS